MRRLLGQRLGTALAGAGAAAACVLALTTPASLGARASQQFSFGSDISAADRTLVTDDIGYAVQDEQSLLGVSLNGVSVFVSGDANWLATQQCNFYGHGGTCVQTTQASYSSGGNAGEGGPGAIFLYWSPTESQVPAAELQKTLAHELFHVFQYQLDGLVHDGETPSNEVRQAGPVWLHEGGPEVVGYHVASDRGLQSYSNVLSADIGNTLRLPTPISSLLTVDDQNRLGGIYAQYLVAVDHLVTVAPNGMHSLVGYYQALANGKTWQDAFVSAFGMSVDSYYSNFAAYQAQLLKASEKCVVPKLTGKSLKAAKTALSATYCRLGKVAHAWSKTVKAGRVVSESPRAGKSLANGARVSLVVSRGKR